MLSRRRLALICGVLLSLSLSAQAAHHALLIGVDYTHCQSDTACPSRLYGPHHDVAALQRLLTARYQFPAAHITTLLGSQATREAILAALQRLQQQTAPQDVILIYFSGHGTSSADPALGLEIAPLSGALVPADARVYTHDPARTLAGMLQGTRDLRPMFSALQETRRVVVIVDACFSGNTVRSLRDGPGLSRHLPLPAVPRSPTATPFPSYQAAFRPRPTAPFPYTNLIYLSAADETERAKDLQHGTLDGQPHGALTNTLLRGLGGAADTNHNGTITYRELHEFVQREVSAHYGHTPQLQAHGGLERPVFEIVPRTTTPAPGLPLPAGPVRVKLEGPIPATLRAALAALSGVTLNEAAYEVLVTPEGTGYTLSLANGDTLCRLEGPEQVATRLARYANVRTLLHLRNPQQRFNVRLQLGAASGQTVFVAGERLDIIIQSEQDATLVVVSVDPQGDVQALRSAVVAGGQVTLPQSALVEAPFGTDYLKVFALPQPPPALLDWQPPPHGDVETLLRLLQGAEGWAETLREVVTVPRP